MSRPWMPLYVADYLADTGHLSTLEHGAYMLLIMHYWQHGELPAEETRISRVCRLSGDEWAESRETLKSLFDEDWRHKRIDEELAEAEEKYRRRAEAGRKGGKSNAEAKPEQCLSNAEAALNQPQPQPPSSPKNKKEAKASSGCDEKFAEFWLAYPRREGPNPRKPAKLVFDRLVAKGADPDRLIAAAQALAVENPTPTRFIPQAMTWLGQERFGDVEPVITGDTFCPEDSQPTRLHVIRYRNENDGHDPPRAVQGGKAGYLIPTTWVKSMQMRQAHG